LRVLGAVYNCRAIKKVLLQVLRLVEVAKPDFASKLPTQPCEELHLVDKLVKVWLDRSVRYGKEVCHTSYSKSVLIIYH